ncbi:MAG: hypothetical protein RL238_3739, partial [Actinomycetota bacterium]
MEAAGTDGLARVALDSLVTACAVLRPVYEGGEVVDLVIADANRAACEYVDLRHDQFVGVPMSALLGGPVGEQELALCRRAVATGVPVDVADHTFESYGRHLPYNRFDVHVVPMGGDVVVSWHDSSQRHRQAAALVESERRRMVLAQHTTDIVYETDDDGLITWVSPSIERVLGLQPAAWIGHRPREVVLPDDVPRVLALRKRVFGSLDAEPSDAVECRYLTVGGDARWMAMRAQVIRIGDEVVGAVIVLRDIQD